MVAKKVSPTIYMVAKNWAKAIFMVAGKLARAVSVVVRILLGKFSTIGLYVQYGTTAERGKVKQILVVL